MQQDLLVNYPRSEAEWDLFLNYAELTSLNTPFMIVIAGIILLYLVCYRRHYTHRGNIFY